MDAMPVRRRAILVCVFGCGKRQVLRLPHGQAVRRGATVRVPPLLSARLCEPAGTGPSARAVEITKDTLAQTTDCRVAHVIGASDLGKHLSGFPASKGFPALMAG